jgi:hypothetical protein
MDFVKKIEKQLDNPGCEFRGKPFWAWNGKLETEELRRQIRVMHHMGLGGFFMHSRPGLQTPYLGDEWFECIGACIDEAKKLGMEAWLYDEDFCPSGYAGGLATKDPKYRMRQLKLEVLSSAKMFKWDSSIIAAFTATIDKRNASNVQQIRKNVKPKLKKGYKILVFRIKITGDSGGDNIFGPCGLPYLDTLNPRAVKKFIEITHARYLKQYGKEFGKTVPGIFTDEPYFGEVFTAHNDPDDPDGITLSQDAGDPKIPWTEKLPEIFKRRYGYDLTERLVELFYNVDGQRVMQSKHNFFDCLTYMFVEAFAKQIGNWCEKTGLMFTGHILMESLLSHQAHVIGGAMRFYEYMQAPGMDLLLEYDREFDTAIQVASAARQFGKKWRLTETYGCTGWQFSFESHKAISDWQVALGINLRCQHLSFYTMQGESKRDYPASISYQSPWWEIYSKVEDYFARIHTVMTKGTETRDLLVVSPVESTWAMMAPGWLDDDVIRKADRNFVKVRDSLLAENIGFDYGDEDILARHAKIIRKSGRVFFKVGKALYTTILLPPMITVRSSTLKLLAEFREAGGKIVFAGKPPKYVDSILSKQAVDISKLCGKAAASGGGLAEAVENCRRVSIMDGSGNQISAAMHLLREDKDSYYLFVCNYGLDLSKSKLVWHKHKIPCGETHLVADRNYQCNDVRIKLQIESKEAIEIDCNEGKLYKAVAKSKSGQLEIRTSLEKCGSRLFVIPKKAKNIKLKPRFNGKKISSKRLNFPSWDVSLSETNNLVLDRPAYRIDGEKWFRPDEILRVDTVIRNKLGIKCRGWEMPQPWTLKYDKNLKSVNVELLYNFEVKDVPSTELSIALENPHLYRIFINDCELSPDACNGWWVDKSLMKIPFSPCLLKTGQNIIRLVCDYDQRHLGFEIVYLLGDFGVRTSNQNISMVKPVSKLKIGDWTKQGLAFYSGSVNYWADVNMPKSKKQGRRIFVKLTKYDGVAVRIWLNGHIAGIIGWAPLEIDITDYVSRGKNKLGIEIFSHRANSHGPLHVDRKETLKGNGIGPFTYRTTGKKWLESYQLIPCS